MDNMDSKQDSNRGSDLRDTKTMEVDSQTQRYDSQRQGYDAQRQNYDSQSSNYDSQKQKYDFQSRDYDSQKQSYDSQRQDFNSQKQSYDSQRQGYNTQKQENYFQKQGYLTNKNFGWEQRDFNIQKLNQFQKLDIDDQSRGDSNVEKEMKKDERQRFLPDNKRPQAILGLGELGHQFSDYIRGIFGYGSNNSYVAKVYSDEVPSFEDPLQIGDIDTSLALITTKYNHVHLYGLSKAYQVVLSIDTKNHQVNKLL